MRFFSLSYPFSRHIPRRSRIAPILQQKAANENKRTNRNNGRSNRINERTNRKNGITIRNYGRTNTNNGWSELPSAPTTTPYPVKFTNKQILIWKKLSPHPLRIHHARLLGSNEVNSPFQQFTHAQLRNSNVFQGLTIAQLRRLGNKMYKPRFSTRSNVNNVLNEVLGTNALRRPMPVPSSNNVRQLELRLRTLRA